MRRRRPFLAGLTLLALAAVAALVGCGDSSTGNGVAARSPAEIVAAAKTAADGASAVHVSGSTVTGGAPITLDLSLVAGEGGRGRIAENGLSFELIALGGTIYISGSAAFYTRFAGAAAAKLLQGKWLKAPAANSSFAGLSSLTELRKLLDTALTTSGKTLVKTGTSIVNGQAAVGVKDAENGTLYVATTGRSYPLKIAKSGAAGGTIGFSEWNRPVTLTAPANAVDIEALRREG